MGGNQNNLSVNDIAELSGVSRSTVSRVLTGHPNVKAETRQRVLALVSQRTQVIGILIPHVVSDLFADPFFPILIQAITTTASAQGYNVMLLLTSSESEAHNFYEQVLNHPLYDGLVIASAVFDYPLLKRLDERGRPYIIIGRPNMELERLNYVNVANEDGAFMLVQHFIHQGKKRIGFIPGMEALTASQDRYLGYQRALASAGLSLDPALVAPSGFFREQGGYESMKALLQQQVEAVFASSDVMALGALRAIQEAGLRVPQDILLGGFDDMPAAATTTPSLTTIRQPITQLGKTAVQALIELLEDKQQAPYQQILPVELIIRGSSRV